jgi:hypothetical protein
LGWSGFKKYSNKLLNRRVTVLKTVTKEDTMDKLLDTKSEIAKINNRRFFKREPQKVETIN